MLNLESLLEELQLEKQETKRVINFLERILLETQEWKGALLGGVSLFRDLSSLRETLLKMIQEQRKILEEIKDQEKEGLDKILNELK